MSNSDTASKLLAYWVPTIERVGLVLVDGTVVELRNHSETPGKTLRVDPSEIEPLRPAVVAMWHTHPENNANLSPMDWYMFKGLPEWTHYIVTETCVRSFIVTNGKVMNHEDHRI